MILRQGALKTQRAALGSGHACNSQERVDVVDVGLLDLEDVNGAKGASG